MARAWLATMVALVCSFSSLAAEPLGQRPHLGAHLAQGPGPQNLTVIGVDLRSPAERAGLRAGDVIDAVDGVPVDALLDGPAGRLLIGRSPGEEVVLACRREGAPIELPVTLGEPPALNGELFTVDHTEVLLPSGDRLRAVVTSPVSDGPRVSGAVLFVQDRSLRTIDPDAPEPNPWGDLVGAVAGAGFVTMRVDPPGVGDSDGASPRTLDFHAQLDAFRVALLTLKARHDVDPDRVFVAGTGTGAAIAAILARDEPVAGVIASGAFLRPWHEVLLHQIRGRWARGMSSQRLEKLMLMAHEALALLSFTDDDAASLAMERPELEGMIDYLAPAGMLAGRSLEFSRQLNRADLASAWRLVNAPTLLLFGEWDPLVIEDDQQRIAKLINLGEGGDAWVYGVPQADHALARQEDERAALTKIAVTKLSPDARETVLAWLASMDTALAQN